MTKSIWFAGILVVIAIVGVVLYFSLHQTGLHYESVTPSMYQTSTAAGQDIVQSWPEAGSSTVVVEGSSTWKEYRVQEWAYGYQMEIPANYYALKSPNGGIGFVVTPKLCDGPGARLVDCQSSFTLGFNGTLNAPYGISQIKANLAQSTSTKALVVDGYPAIQVANPSSSEYPGDRTVYVFKGNDFYQFYIENDNPNQAAFDHLLATFKFLPPSQSLSYTNTQYGFKLQLPLSWQGFSESTGTVNIMSLSDDAKILGRGNLVQINDPRTTKNNFYGDVPIMVFTPQQWQLVSGKNPQGTLGAAPIGPALLGQNNKYIFALPARYNYTDAINWGEVDVIVHTFKTF